MYFLLSSKLTRRLILELRDFFSYFTQYNTNPNDSLVNNIRSKYKNVERSNKYITVRGSGSSNKVPMAPDDFMGWIDSYVSLKPVEGFPGVSIEWVGENALAIQRNGGQFPTPPGMYFIQICDYAESPDESLKPSFFRFNVEQVLDVPDETLYQLSDTQFQLGNDAFVEGTLRLYRMPGNVPMGGSEFEADPETGLVTLSEPLPSDEFLSADYRVRGPTTGPFMAQRNHSNIQAIPGAYLAFGQRITKGDRLLLEVTPTREICDMEFGGRWETSIDIEVVARDIDTQREILEHALIFIAGPLRSKWSIEGIEILQVNAGGESEELYDQNDYSFRGTISISVETEWGIRVPTVGRVRRVEAMEGNPEDISDDLATQLGSLVRFGPRGFVDWQDPFYTQKPNSINLPTSAPTQALIR